MILSQNGGYSYSPLNQNEEDKFSKKILKYINANIEKFLDCGTKGIPIKINKKILAGWIKQHYEKKSAKFIITSEHESQFEDNFIQIISLENFEKNFEISAVLRCKKSGSSHMPEKDFDYVEKILERKFGKEKFKLFQNGEIQIKNYSNNKEYLPEGFYISKKEKKFYIKKLSSTNNPSLIFSLKYIGSKQIAGKEKLIEEINKKIKL